MNKKLLKTISLSNDIITELNEDTYMRRHNIVEHIEVFFAVDISLLEDISKLNKLDEIYKYIDYTQEDNAIYNHILNSRIIELKKEKIYIETTCTVTPRRHGDELELENNINVNNTCLSLTLIWHDNEEDVFNKFFRNPKYYQNKKSNYKTWGITQSLPFNNYFDIIYLLDKLRIMLMLDIRAQLKSKIRNTKLNMNKYNPLPLLRMIRFIPYKYSPTNMEVQIVKKDEFCKKLVKYPFKEHADFYISFK